MTTPPANLAFTKLVVHDLDLVVPFYEEVCGLRRVQRVQAEIAGEPIDEIICTSESGASLIFLQWVGRAAASPDTEVIIGITTSDIAACFERATAAGGRVREAPAANAAAGGMKVGFLEDPEGHLVEVVETA